ncbi:hypothetical protein ACJU26_12405 [Acidithiobacillus sp. M4-SHS-6]|uniref:hypothetical protein n=1 Tax=Acidithiobacillus sp. M4-SHS-6 TaxID=3383024 RepID=UPI0039BDE81E
MKRLPNALSIIGPAGVSDTAQAVNRRNLGDTKVGTAETLKQFHAYSKERNPNMPLENYALGTYAFSPEMYRRCDKKVGAVPQPLGSADDKRLEYFMRYLSNGTKINVPGYRPEMQRRVMILRFFTRHHHYQIQWGIS